MRIYMQNQPDDSGNHRYYQLLLQADLLEGCSVIVEAGVVGKAGRIKRLHFDDWDEAQESLIAMRDAQLQRGFKVMFVHGQESRK